MHFARLALTLLVPPAIVVSSFGCSDPVPPTPRGAFSVSFVEFPVIECQIGGHNTKVGDVTDSTKAKLINDAEDDTEVECDVSGSGTFRATGSIFQKKINFLEIVIPGIAPSTSEAAPAKGSIAFSSFNTSGEAYSSDQCDFWFDNSQQGVDAGKLWVAFKCDAVTGEQSTCKISQGYVIFENCGTGAED